MTWPSYQQGVLTGKWHRYLTERRSIAVCNFLLVSDHVCMLVDTEKLTAPERE